MVGLCAWNVNFNANKITSRAWNVIALHGLDEIV